MLKRSRFYVEEDERLINEWLFKKKKEASKTDYKIIVFGKEASVKIMYQYEDEPDNPNRGKKVINNIDSIENPAIKKAFTDFIEKSDSIFDDKIWSKTKSCILEWAKDRRLRGQFIDEIKKTKISNASDLLDCDGSILGLIRSTNGKLRLMFNCGNMNDDKTSITYYFDLDTLKFIKCEVTDGNQTISESFLSFFNEADEEDIDTTETESEEESDNDTEDSNVDDFESMNFDASKDEYDMDEDIAYGDENVDDEDVKSNTPTTMAVDVDITTMGSDNSPVQNQYSPKEIERLNNLLSSENQAIGEYFQASKETNVDILRRLYSDIGEEERFHSEQLLFAKSQLTGEPYVPRDPDVKKEYEELLALGMDEESAMTTAVDKVGISRSINASNEEIEQKMEAAIEDMEFIQRSLYQEYVLMNIMSTPEYNRERVIKTYTEAYINETLYTVDVVMEDVVNNAENPPQKTGILKMIIKIITGIGGAIRKILDNMKSWGTSLKSNVERKREWLKNHSLADLFRSGVHMYFFNDKTFDFDFESPAKYMYRILDCAEAILKQLGVGTELKRPYLTFPSDTHTQYVSSSGDNLEAKITELSNVKLEKTKIPFSNDKIKEIFATKVFQIRIGSAGIENNTFNTSVHGEFTKLLSNFNNLSTFIGSIAQRMEKMQQEEHSIYFSDRAKYDKYANMIKTLTTCCQKFMTALSSDISEMMKTCKYFNNEVMKGDLATKQNSSLIQGEIDRIKQVLSNLDKEENPETQQRILTNYIDQLEKLKASINTESYMYRVSGHSRFYTEAEATAQPAQQPQQNQQVSEDDRTTIQALIDLAKSLLEIAKQKTPDKLKKAVDFSKNGLAHETAEKISKKIDSIVETINSDEFGKGFADFIDNQRRYNPVYGLNNQLTKITDRIYTAAKTLKKNNKDMNAKNILTDLKENQIPKLRNMCNEFIKKKNNDNNGNNNVQEGFFDTVKGAVKNAAAKANFRIANISPEAILKKLDEKEHEIDELLRGNTDVPVETPQQTPEQIPEQTNGNPEPTTQQPQSQSQNQSTQEPQSDQPGVDSQTEPKQQPGSQTEDQKQPNETNDRYTTDLDMKLLETIRYKSLPFSKQVYSILDTLEDNNSELGVVSNISDRVGELFEQLFENGHKYEDVILKYTDDKYSFPPDITKTISKDDYQSLMNIFEEQTKIYSDILNELKKYCSENGISIRTESYYELRNQYKYFNEAAQQSQSMNALGKVMAESKSMFEKIKTKLMKIFPNIKQKLSNAGGGVVSKLKNSKPVKAATGYIDERKLNDDFHPVITQNARLLKQLNGEYNRIAGKLGSKLTSATKKTNNIGLLKQLKERAETSYQQFKEKYNDLHNRLGDMPTQTNEGYKDVFNSIEKLYMEEFRVRNYDAGEILKSFATIDTGYKQLISKIDEKMDSINPLEAERNDRDERAAQRQQFHDENNDQFSSQATARRDRLNNLTYGKGPKDPEYTGRERWDDRKKYGFLGRRKLQKTPEGISELYAVNRASIEYLIGLKDAEDPKSKQYSDIQFLIDRIQLEQQKLAEKYQAMTGKTIEEFYIPRYISKDIIQEYVSAIESEITEDPLFGYFS